MPSQKPNVLLMGQTPPPWHGQAVATQILFDHDWPDFEIHRLRMEYSEEMLEVGRFQWKKIRHLFSLIRQARQTLKQHPGCILFYPPASAKWIPFIRDVVFLTAVRPLAGATIFIFHASGLPAFARRGIVRRTMGRLAYHGADVALEVAQEALTPHEVFAAKSWQWCPCAIDVPDRRYAERSQNGPLTVLFVGSLQEGKGVLEILKTASILKQQGRENDFRFRLVGKWFSNEFEVSVRHLRSELELDNMVELTGQLTGDAKWDAYFTADVFFFPTHYESEATPIVLMEALGAGLPIISTQWAGIPAMLEGCKTASLLPVHSPNDYADTLIGILAQRHEQDKTSEASRDFYQNHFLPARFLERVEKALVTASSASSNTEHQKPNRRDDMNVVYPYSEPTATVGELCASAVKPSSGIRVTAYLADQNPGHDRSFGISRMSQVVLAALQSGGGVDVEAIASRTSQQAPGVKSIRNLPWGTRGKWVRLLTDHLHPLFDRTKADPDLYYFPKGFLPLLSVFCRPSAVTIHDTIIQYDEDHYPEWRKPVEYRYWAVMLKHTLKHADSILTVSESSKAQIIDFMERHGIPPKEITVTYEPCLYEQFPQPAAPPKKDYVIHLASREPHKRTAQLVKWWIRAEREGKNLPILHLIGTLPGEVAPLLASARTLVKRPFLEDSALRDAYASARALILPSEIEGFGLPALEAYYLGTPVCYVEGTSVEEILSNATSKGRFSLEDSDSLFSALDEVMRMSPEEVRECGLRLREEYAAKKVAARMESAFRALARPN